MRLWLLFCVQAASWKFYPSQCVRASGCEEAKDGFYIVLEFSLDDPQDVVTLADLQNKSHRWLQCKALHLRPVALSSCPDNKAQVFCVSFLVMRGLRAGTVPDSLCLPGLFWPVAVLLLLSAQAPGLTKAHAVLDFAGRILVC